MSYELARQKKERQHQFELEMQRRMADLRVYLDFMNWTHYLQTHTRQTKPSEKVIAGNRLLTTVSGTSLVDTVEGYKIVEQREGTSEQLAMFQIPSHLPNSLEEWIHSEVKEVGR